MPGSGAMSRKWIRITSARVAVVEAEAVMALRMKPEPDEVSAEVEVEHHRLMAMKQQVRASERLRPKADASGIRRPDTPVMLRRGASWLRSMPTPETLPGTFHSGSSRNSKLRE